jgi:hypothetical protein
VPHLHGARHQIGGKLICEDVVGHYLPEEEPSGGKKLLFEQQKKKNIKKTQQPDLTKNN